MLFCLWQTVCFSLHQNDKPLLLRIIYLCASKALSAFFHIRQKSQYIWWPGLSVLDTEIKGVSVEKQVVLFGVFHQNLKNCYSDFKFSMNQKQHAVHEFSRVYRAIVLTSVLIWNTPGPCVTLFLVLWKICVNDIILWIFGLHWFLKRMYAVLFWTLWHSF